MKKLPTIYSCHIKEELRRTRVKNQLDSSLPRVRIFMLRIRMDRLHSMLQSLPSRKYFSMHSKRSESVTICCDAECEFRENRVDSDTQKKFQMAAKLFNQKPSKVS